MWYEAHDSMAKHPKTLKLARLLKVKRREAVGLLHDLFSWALYAADKYGRLNGLERGDIAAALEMTGKAGDRTVDALVDAGYLELSDGLYSVHDWYDYAGKFSDERERDRARKRDRTRKKMAQDDGKRPEVRENSTGHPTEFHP